MGLVGVRCDCHRDIAVMISVMVVVMVAVSLHQTIWFWCGGGGGDDGGGGLKDEIGGVYVCRTSR